MMSRLESGYYVVNGVVAKYVGIRHGKHLFVEEKYHLVNDLENVRELVGYVPTPSIAHEEDDYSIRARANVAAGIAPNY